MRPGIINNLKMISHKIAYIDLEKRAVEIKDIGQDLISKFLGGRGINAYLLFNHTKKGLDPLSGENPLIIGPGLLTGLRGVTMARTTISGVSPDTGLLGDANIGGHFGSWLKRTPFSYLVIKGKSTTPVYILIENEKISFLDADFLWGKDTQDAQDLLKKKHTDNAQCLVIGPAGENLVKFACIMHRKKNAAARTGLGCLMGVKLLKAIVVNAGGVISAKHPDEFNQLMQDIYKKLDNEFLTQSLSEFGTAHLFDVINNNIGMGRVYNGLTTVFKNNLDISPQNLKEKYYTQKSGCFGCRIACQHKHKIVSKRFGTIENEGPEYGVIAYFGPVLGINNLEAILKINDVINRLGLDASSSANVIAWMIDLFKSGVINEKFTRGLKLEWGNEDLVLKLLDLITYRQGFGDFLANGAREMLKGLPPASQNAVYCSKYLLQSDPVDLRYISAFALGDAVATRGADHLRSRPIWEAFGLDEKELARIYGGRVSNDPQSYEGKGRVIWWWENYTTIFDCLGMCKLLAFHTMPGVFDFEIFAKIINSAIGLDLTAEDVLKIGERVNVIERMFLNREGIARPFDSLPKRYFEPLKIQEGLRPEDKDLKLTYEGFNRMLDEYYKLRGLNNDGFVLEETRQRLSLQ